MINITKFNTSKARQDIYGYILVGFSFLVLTLITVKTFAPEIRSEAANQTASQTLGPYTMSMSNDSVTDISIVPTATQTIYTATNNLSVTNTCDAGATITMTTNSTTSNSLTRAAVNSDLLTKEIAATTSTSLDNNSWGYALNNSSTYYAVPKKDETAATIYDASAAQTSALSVPITFGVKIDNNMPSGTYSNDILYTMTPKSGCNSYSVTWNYDGGTAKSGVTYPTSLSWGATVNLSNLEPTKSGYTFAGWTNGSADFTGSETAANLNSSNAKSITVTAKWTEVCPSGVTCSTVTLSNNQSKTFSYTGSVEAVTLTNGGYYKMQLWGASGGGADPGTGGDGGFISGNINISAGQIVYFLVGQKGQTGELSGSSTRTGSKCEGYSTCRLWAQNRAFGFGGMGDTAATDGSFYGGTGAGGSFVYLHNNVNDASNLIIVAGGGGGASDETYSAGTNYSYGGYYAGHGNNNGGDGINQSGTTGCSRGGTQTAGGSVVTSTCSTATAGKYLYGGDGGTTGSENNNANPGGGGGYYGGSGGEERLGSGGGGSSYINTTYGTQNTSETATVMAGGAKNADGLDGKIIITYLGTTI